MQNDEAFEEMWESAAAAHSPASASASRTQIPAGTRLWICEPVAHADPACPEIDWNTAETGTAPERTGWPCTCVDDALGITHYTDPAFGQTENVPSPAGGFRPSAEPAVQEDDLTDADAEALIQSLGRKFEADDMTPARVRWVWGWLKAYEGSFEFLLDVRSKSTTGRLSDGQAKGVWNCARAGLFRGEWGAAPDRTPSESDIDLSGLPSGRYAVPDGETRLKLRVDHITKDGRWKDFIFVKDDAEYGQGTRYGMQKPGEAYKGDVQDALRKILADPEAAAAAYGKLVGRCGLCGRRLEDETSVERGIGPVCAAKAGW